MLEEAEVLYRHSTASPSACGLPGVHAGAGRGTPRGRVDRQPQAERLSLRRVLCEHTPVSPSGEHVAGPQRIALRLRALGLSSGVYFAAEVFSLSLGFLLIPLYTRLLSPADYRIIAVVSR
jgi:hypothetical protein